MGKQGADWSQDEDAVLLANRELTATELMPLLPNRSKKAIQLRRIYIVTHPPRYQRNWTPEEDQALMDMLDDGKTAREIGLKLDRLTNAIKHRIKRLRAQNSDMVYVKPSVACDPWENVPANAFQDVKVSADPRTTMSKPVNQTVGGVGSRMLLL
jgi:hypothetical protein